MHTSCIRHPENSPFIMRRGWIIKALQADRPIAENGKKNELPETGAELISVFEYQYNNRWANTLLRELVAKSIRKHRKPAHETGEWLPYTLDYLRELLLGGRGTHTINGALALMLDKGFISMDVPIDITDHYSQKFKWIRLEVDTLNMWVENNCEKSWMNDWEIQKPIRNIESRMPKPVIDTETKTQITHPNGLMTMSAQVDAICGFHKYIHSKNGNYVYDSNRKSKVGARIKEKRTLGQCAQVIIGNRLSEHHQGQNDRQEVYDDIELMFRNAQKFELHVKIAERNGVTEAIAQTEFEAFLAGNTSKYAKRQPQAAQTASDEQTQAPQRPALSDDERRKYRAFARNVVSFFLTKIANKEIIEMCAGNDGLNASGKGLTDSNELAICLLDASKTYRPNGLPQDTVIQIENFAVTWTKVQKANS